MATIDHNPDVTTEDALPDASARDDDRPWAAAFDDDDYDWGA